MPDTDTSVADEMENTIDPDGLKYVYSADGEILTVGNEYQVKQSDIKKFLKYATDVDVDEIVTDKTTDFFDVLLGDDNLVSKILGWEYTVDIAGVLDEGAKAVIAQQIINATIEMNELDILINSASSGPDGDMARAVIEEMKETYASGWIGTIQSAGKSIGVAALQEGGKKVTEKLLGSTLGAPYKVVTFAREIGLGVSGLSSYADAEFNCLAIEAYLCEIESTLYDLIADGVTDERLIDTYDLWRAAMIAKMEQAKKLTSDESEKADLDYEIKQLQEMTIDKWHTNTGRQYYWSDYTPNDGSVY